MATAVNTWPTADDATDTAAADDARSASDANTNTVSSTFKYPAATAAIQSAAIRPATDTVTTGQHTAR